MKLDRKKKKLLLSVTAVAAAAALGIGIFFGTRDSGEVVGVYPFMYLGMTEFWGDSQESYGPVSTERIQTVFLSDTQTVTEILVKAGDTVKKGDKLMSFDTTLDSLALERKRLEGEKIQLEIKQLQHQLGEVNDTIPEDDPIYNIPVEPTEPDLGAELTAAYRISTNSRYDGSTPEKALICWLQDASDISNSLLEALYQRAAEFQNRNSGKPVSSASAIPVETTQPTEIAEPVETTQPTVATEPVETTQPTEVTEPEETTQPTVATEPEETTPPTETTEPEETTQPTETTEPEETTQPTETTEPEETTQPTETTEPEETVKPEETTQPTEPDESAPVSEYYVIFKVTEDNMALGAVQVWQGMQVFRNASGGFSFRFFDAAGNEDHSIVPEEEEEEEETWPEVDIVISYTTEELARMRADLMKQIKEQEFKLKMSEAEYKIMQRELSDGNIYSEIDGEVVSVLTEEEAKQAKQPVIKVSGGGGFYAEGSVSELEKDNLKIGQEVTINDWNSGMTYTGEVTSIGDFPSTDDGWNGMGNPNASYYPFRVFIDGSADLQAGRYVSMTYSTSGAENGIYLENPFVLTEQGESYVYVLGENGRLEKRAVITGKSLWGSYTQILSGLSEDDLIAFPYGKNVKDGARAEEQDISSLYSY